MRPHSHLVSGWWMLSSFLPALRFFLVNGNKIIFLKEEESGRKVSKGEMQGGRKGEQQRSEEEWEAGKNKSSLLKEFIFSILFLFCLCP